MLEHVRMHPELVTGTKDHELDPTRWVSLLCCNNFLYDIATMFSYTTWAWFLSFFFLSVFSLQVEEIWDPWHCYWVCQSVSGPQGGILWGGLCHPAWALLWPAALTPSWLPRQPLHWLPQQLWYNHHTFWFACFLSLFYCFSFTSITCCVMKWILYDPCA